MHHPARSKSILNTLQIMSVCLLLNPDTLTPPCLMLSILTWKCFLIISSSLGWMKASPLAPESMSAFSLNCMPCCERWQRAVRASPPKMSLNLMPYHPRGLSGAPCGNSRWETSPRVTHFLNGSPESQIPHHTCHLGHPGHQGAHQSPWHPSCWCPGSSS